MVIALINAGGSFHRPILAATIFGLFWGSFTLLGIYLCVFSRKYLLVIDDQSIFQTGVFSKKRILIRKLEVANWRNWPGGGSIKLKSQQESLAIELATFELSHRESLVELLRSKIPHHKQSNWEQFLRNPANVKDTPQVSPAKFGWLFYAMAAIFAVGWWFGFGSTCLFAAAVNTAFATYLVSSKKTSNESET